MTARAAALLAVAALAATLVPAGPGAPETAAQSRYRGTELLPDPVLPDTSASLAKHVRENVDRYATPEFRKRLALRREFQRAGYAAVLHDVLAFDAPGALLSYLRTRLRLEYSLPHNTIYFRDDTGALVPLPEDWTFPADPWEE